MRRFRGTNRGRRRGGSQDHDPCAPRERCGANEERGEDGASQPADGHEEQAPGKPSSTSTIDRRPPRTGRKESHGMTPTRAKMARATRPPQVLVRRVSMPEARAEQRRPRWATATDSNHTTVRIGARRTRGCACRRDDQKLRHGTVAGASAGSPPWRRPRQSEPSLPNPSRPPTEPPVSISCDGMTVTLRSISPKPDPAHAKAMAPLLASSATRVLLDVEDLEAAELEHQDAHEEQGSGRSACSARSLTRLRAMSVTP